MKQEKLTEKLEYSHIEYNHELDTPQTLSPINHFGTIYIKSNGIVIEDEKLNISLDTNTIKSCKNIVIDGVEFVRKD